jgi:ribosomal protein S18 acetylase RimI-like enzyme
MEIVKATQAHVAAYADQIGDLFHATGPASYDYQFGERSLFDKLINASWSEPETLFAFDETTLALQGDELLGIEVGFQGSDFEARKKALTPLWVQMFDTGEVKPEDLTGLGKRAYQCSFLNPSIPQDVYYIHALSVKEQHRGKQIGAKLLLNAMEEAKRADFQGLHLDVLSDNPAVNFYQSMGLECLVESTAPVPLKNGVPAELRMAIRFQS